MKRTDLSLWFTIWAAASSAMLAGCGAAQTTPPEAGVESMSGGKTWMSPEAKSVKRLLYLANGAWVYVYDYDNLQLLGEVRGLDTPLYDCVDASGNVWVLEQGGGSRGPGAAVEIARGGSSPVRTLVTSGLPDGCSVAPNGDLAVMNFDAPDYGRGNVEVFGPASSTPLAYTGTSDCYSMIGGGYDNKGNLFVIADSTEGFAKICELPVGGETVAAAPVNQTIQDPQGIMWDGKYLAVTNDEGLYKADILQLHEAASGALTVVGDTSLADSCYKNYVDIYPQPFIVGKRNTPVNDTQGNELIGRNYICGLAPSDFGFWAYPKGGSPKRTLSVDSGTGVTVSIGK